MGENTPDPQWIEWAEAESVRRLTISLAEIRARKAGEAPEEPERSYSAWAPPSPEPEVQQETSLEVRVVPSAQPERVIRIHDANLQDA